MPVILTLSHISMILEFQELPQRNWEKDTLIILQYGPKDMDTATVTDMQITNCRDFPTNCGEVLLGFGTNMAFTTKTVENCSNPILTASS